ncbi:MAG: Hsp20/alpha crystallin family protein, partial [Desulfovibrio sp.]|nr:Hsp20/alpha crystallin family protein [Desulfovibrio sp.]
MRTTPLLPTRIHTNAPITRGSIHDEINDYFRNAFTGFPFLWGKMPGNPFGELGAHEGLIPSLDMISDEKAYAVVVELPGIEPEDITLEAKDNTLSISGEKKVERRDEDNKHV